MFGVYRWSNRNKNVNNNLIILGNKLTIEFREH